MGRIVVEQPNGKWAVWSTVVDDFILLDCDEPDLFVTEVFDAARMSVEETERRVRWRGLKTWEGCLATRREIHGREPDFREDPFDGAVSGGHPGDWTAFFEIKLAELCEAYYAHLMEIRKGNAEDPPVDDVQAPLPARALRARYEELLAQLVANRRSKNSDED